MLGTYRKVLGVIGIVLCLFSSVFAYSGGSGEPNDPYQIAAVSDWQQLMNTPSDCNKNFIMTADINLQGIALTPVGFYNDGIGPSFTGVFDGNGHIIRNAEINMPGFGYFGLFGCIGPSGQIHNLGVEDVRITGDHVGGLVGLNYQGTITACYAIGIITASYDSVAGGGGLVAVNYKGSITACYATGAVTGSNCDGGVGGLVGGNYQGTITDCCATGVVTGRGEAGGLVGNNGGIITACYATGAVTGGIYVGGLVGDHYDGTITACYATGAVTGKRGVYSGECVGGLVGSITYGSVSDSYSTGTVTGDGDYVGGLVGQNNDGDITACYATGAITGGSYVGGLVGVNWGGAITVCYSTGMVSGDDYVGGLVGTNCQGIITDCYATGMVTGSSSVGGLVGYNISGSISTSFWDVNTSGQTTSAGGTGKTTEQMQDINTFLNSGWDFINETANGTCNYWQMPAGGGYPVLSTFNGYIPPEPSGSGTKNDPYIITDANDLGTIWYRPTAHYRLSNDIDLAGIQWSVAVIPVFSGVLDGNGFCIRNLSINGGGYLGLFGLITSDGSVKNFGLENCAVSGSFCVGRLVGYNNFGNINNCYSTGTVSGSSCVGGLVGWNNYGSISNCYSTGVVSSSSRVGGLVGLNNGSSISNCYSTGVVSGSSRVGGLVGYNDGSISNCYSTGAVDGDSNTGGLVGYNYQSGVVNASFWDVNTSGWTTSAGGEGKTTEEMQTLSTFTSAGWDFSYTDGDEADWFIQIDEYPILTWQISPADIYTDGKNNFRDFAVFAQYWMREDCAIYNYYCEWADMDFNGSVDIYDLIEFMSYWLEFGIYN